MKNNEALKVLDEIRPSRKRDQNVVSPINEMETSIPQYNGEAIGVDPVRKCLIVDGVQISFAFLFALTQPRSVHITIERTGNEVLIVEHSECSK